MVFSSLSTGLLAFACCCALVAANRDSHHKIGVTRDGHFQLSTDDAEHSGASAARQGTRKIEALKHMEKEIEPVQVIEPNGWSSTNNDSPRQQQKEESQPSSSFANRTNDWMTLSQVGSGSLGSHHLDNAAQPEQDIDNAPAAQEAAVSASQPVTESPQTIAAPETTQPPISEQDIDNAPAAQEPADSQTQPSTGSPQTTAAPSTTQPAAVPAENQEPTNSPQVGAGQESTPASTTAKPTVPQRRYTHKPKAWPMRAWSTYQRAYEKLAPLRGGAGGIASTLAAAAMGPDSCILKISYVFFSMDGEDDYPYVPRGCGDMFDFALTQNAASSISTPWMLIIGAVLITINSLS